MTEEFHLHLLELVQELPAFWLKRGLETAPIPRFSQEVGRRVGVIDCARESRLQLRLETESLRRQLTP